MTSASPEPGASEGAAAVFTAGQRWLLLEAFALIIVFRLPHVWFHGRFLDEEATVFLAYAWHHPPLDALLRPFAGYLNLGATGTTVLAVALVKHGLLPLERAPYLTTGIALAVQLLPAALILTGRARWLASRPAVIAALLIVALAPSSEEVFYNVLHIQFHLALCTALILSLDPPRRRTALFGHGVLLFLAPLCGPGAVVILPVFALRWLIDRDRARLVQLGSFAAGTAAQLLLFYGASPMRGHLFDPATIAATMFVRLIALPALGLSAANGIGTAVYHSWIAGGIGWWGAVAAAALVFGALIVVAARRRDPAIWLLLSGLSIAAASLGFGMVILDPFALFSVGAGERYNFLPLVLIGLTLIVLATRAGSRRWRLFAVPCGLMLLTGAVGYAWPLPDFDGGPSWPAEVAAWRLDHRRPLTVWPGHWTADLSDEAHVCAPIGRDPARSSDPRYCESGWVASFHGPRAPH